MLRTKMNRVRILTQNHQGGYIINNPSHHLGLTLKTIRTNKGYTQQEVSINVMSRSNYTKVEMGEVNPNTVKFLSILDRMDMSEAEFSFVLNDYTLSEKNNILYLFKNMSQSPALSYVQNLIKLSTESLKKQDDHLIRDILNIALSYQALLNEHDLVKAQTCAEKVWLRLEKYDKFYLTEFHLLNRILFFFEIETAVFMTDIALISLENYYSFKEAEDLRFSFMSNLACILIDNKQYSQAMGYVKLLITQSKKTSNMIVLAAALVRQGMCQEATGQSDQSNASYQEAIDIFKILERSDLINSVVSDPKTVLNPYGYINLLVTRSSV